MSDYERILPRSFTGLTDEEWHQFDTVVRSFLGRGKRSLFLCIMVRKVIETARWNFERNAKIEQRADHAVHDTFKGVGRMEDGV